jgi:alpha-beta hydrolase superfamily lysophospholipase
MGVRARISLILAALLGLSPATYGATGPRGLPDGYWSGWAERDGVRSEVALRLTTDGGELTGTVDWASMGYFRTDLISAQIDGSDVAFSVPLPLGALKLLGTLKADIIKGTLDPIGLVRGEWQSLGKGGAFELQRSAEPPVPYRIEEVTFQSRDATIAGSIFLPIDDSPHPGVVFVAGSGDTTRGDGAFLADQLARAGIAVLVYDKRGAGKSTGDWRKGGFEELAADATGALRLLQRHSGIQEGKSGFVCQSQGCWIVPVALRNGAPARFAVLQSGPAVSVADEDLDYYRVTLASQGFGRPEIEEAFALVRTGHEFILGSARPADLAAAIAKYQDRAWFKELGYSAPSVDDPGHEFDRRTLSYEPSDDIDAIRVPSLWIYGEADTIIPVQASIEKVKRARTIPRPEIRMLTAAGHSFTIGTTTIPRLAGEYPGIVIEWIKSRQ